MIYLLIAIGVPLALLALCALLGVFLDFRSAAYHRGYWFDVLELKTIVEVALCVLGFAAGAALLFYFFPDPGQCMHLSYLPC